MKSRMKTKDLADSLGASLLDDLEATGEPVSTGCKAFDFFLQGGIPSGLITEFVGDFSTGKSLLGLQVCRECINSNGVAIYIDSENSMNKSWASDVLKVDPKQLIYFVAADLEDTYAFLKNALKSMKGSSIPSIVVWDSLAATPPASIKNEEGSTMAAAARVNSQQLPTLLNDLRASNTALVLINQLRSKIGVLFGQKWDSYGGRALKFYSSLRIHIIRKGKVSSGKSAVGTKGRAEIIKSRICRPFTYLDFTIDFEQGITPWSGTLELFTKAGFIKTSGRFKLFKLGKTNFKFRASDIIKPDVLNLLWRKADKKKLLSALTIKEK